MECQWDFIRDGICPASDYLEGAVLLLLLAGMRTKRNVGVLNYRQGQESEGDNCQNSDQTLLVFIIPTLGLLARGKS